MKLWSYNPITGLWRCERTCKPSEAQRWLEYWRRTDPTIAFRLAKHKPKGKPRDGERRCERDDEQDAEALRTFDWGLQAELQADDDT